MNKEKGIYELLPDEPVDVAAMLIKATIVTDAPVFAPLSPMLEGKTVAIPKYDPVQLQEIAEHLLVYCNAQERDTKMSVVKIVNPNPYDWMGTQYFIDGHKVPRVKSVDFHVAVDEVPTFNFEMMGRPDIEMECLAQISVSSQSITDAISILRHELLQHGEIYQGFKSSLKSALEIYSTCGLPFEPEEETAEKILDFMIGEKR